MSETHRTQTYEVRGLSLAYHSWGDPDAPLVLFLHGFLDHGLSFSPVAEEVARSGRRVVALDFRGHGYSGWVGEGGDYHFPDYFHDTLVLLETLGSKSVAIVGHSMGGSVASGVAALLGDTVEAIVLLEGMGPPAEPASTAVDRLRRWRSALVQGSLRGGPAARSRARRPLSGVEGAAGRLMKNNRRLDPERARALASTFTEPANDGSDAVVWRFDPLHLSPAARRFDVEEGKHVWSSISAPVLSLEGSESVFVLQDVAERHACLRNVRVAWVEGAGHNIHHDRPDAVTGAVLWWLSGDRSGSLPPGLIPSQR